MRTTTKTTIRPTSVGNSVTRDANLVKKNSTGATTAKDKMTNERYTPSKPTPKTTVKSTSMGNSRGRIK